MSAYHIAGELLRTDMDAVADALADGAWRLRRKSIDELIVESLESSFEIYASDIGEAGSFLVSGEADGTLDQVRVEIAVIGRRLAGAGIVYHFELSRIGEPDDYHVIEHPEY